jgi:hypothetical protein
VCMAIKEGLGTIADAIRTEPATKE